MLPFFLPTYEDIKHFMEYTTSDEEEWKRHLNINESKSKDIFYSSMPYLPRHMQISL